MPVIAEPRHDVADIEDALARVYADFPGLPAAECLRAIHAALGAGAVFYGGQFNGKWVAGALVQGEPGRRRLAFLAVHPATRRRGVARRLLAEVARLEARTGSTALEARAVDATSEALLRSAGFQPFPPGPGESPGLRCPLPPAG